MARNIGIAATATTGEATAAAAGADDARPRFLKKC